MPDVSIVFDIVRFLAPGLLFIQVLYLLGFTRRGSDSEWVMWGIIFSIPIRWAGTQLVTRLGLEANPLTFEMYLLAVALVGSLVPALAKSLLSFEAEVED